MTLHRLRRADVLPSVGRECESWCTACKRVLDHVITAMNGREIVQVRCRTCGSVHRFKGAAASAAAAASPKATAAAVPKVSSGGKAASAPAAEARPPTQRPAAAAERQRYQRQLAERDVATALDYSPALRPAVGALLRHARFGYGLVEALGDGKAQILFSDGIKLLVVGR